MNKKIKIPVVAIEETQEEVQSDSRTKPAVIMTLAEKVMNFISKHPNGVKILDMEKPLGVGRMKIGYVTENLFNEGKVLKKANCYFPVKIQ